VLNHESVLHVFLSPYYGVIEVCQNIDLALSKQTTISAEILQVLILLPEKVVREVLNLEEGGESFTV